jgi:N-methylhydantoinase B
MMTAHELESLDEIASHVLSTSRAAMEREISALPAGIYENSMDVDGYDVPVHIECAMHVHRDRILIDFSGSSPTSRYGINVPANYTEAYASFGVRCLVGNSIPNNAGSLGTIRVTAPEGSILNAMPPCAVSARHALGQMLPDVIMGCLEQIMPESVAAEGASCIWNPVLMNAPQTGGDVADTPFVINPIYNGGTGARFMKDGLSTTAFPSGVRTTPTEINEVTSPLIFERREFSQDSGGRGRHRGGLGQIVEIRHGRDNAFFVSKMFDRIEHSARGRAGGGNGRPGKVYIKDGTPLRGKGKDLVPAGATLVLETPGGGGFGNPSERNENDIRGDVEDGFVSGTS